MKIPFNKWRMPKDVFEKWRKHKVVEEDEPQQPAVERQNRGVSPRKRKTLIYRDEDFDLLDEHVATGFGVFETVFYEVIEDDIRMDIAVVAPTVDQNYYTLVTMGLGAWLMDVPKEMSEFGLWRAELVVCLPPDWKINDGDDRWHWPITWMKKTARHIIEKNDWVSWGKILVSDEPFVPEHNFNGTLFVYPEEFTDETSACELKDGTFVNFYQMIPLYKTETTFCQENGASALLAKIDEQSLSIIDVERFNYLWE